MGSGQQQRRRASSAAALPEPELFGDQLRFQSGGVNINNNNNKSEEDRRIGKMDGKLAFLVSENHS